MNFFLFLGACCNFLGTLLNRFPELGSRNQFIHQFPLQSTFTTDALGDGAEKIGMIPANFPFIHHSRQPSCPRQYCQQRHLWKRNRAGTVIDEHDVLRGQCHFVSSPGCSSIQGRKINLSGMLTGVFNFIAGFVGEFAEIHLVAMGGKAQHRDVCSRAEYPIVLRS